MKPGVLCESWGVNPPKGVWETGVTRNFICGVHIFLYMSNLLDDKIPQRVNGGDGSRCQICKFWNPFCIFGTCNRKNNL